MVSSYLLILYNIGVLKIFYTSFNSVVLKIKLFKFIVGIMSSELPFVEWGVRFITAPLRAFSAQLWFLYNKSDSQSKQFMNHQN